jgi:aryl-alcohol dehydrogenase-like predicted oxidoreductase
MSNASASGTFRIGGKLAVHRMGFGAMRVTGPGIWGPPRDRAGALAVLRRLPELGVNFIDTADSYGPDVSEELIREALHPYAKNGELVIATKAGFTRSGPDRWTVNTKPSHLKEAARKSLKKLGVGQIALWQLHRVSGAIPAADQFGAVRELLDEGIIRHAGLSEVSVAEIRAAQKVFPVATVQNHYHLASRESDDVLDYCEANGIGFIPWYPLGAGDLAEGGAALDKVAKAHGATPAQIALAWLLKRSPVMLPIPGTSKVEHLEENVAASGIRLSDEEFRALRR